MTLADRLKMARMASGKTQSEVAQAVGMKQPSYNAIESGKVQRSGYLTDIAIYLGVNTNWLATGQGEMVTKPSFEELKSKVKEIEKKTTGELEPSDFLKTNSPVPIVSWVAAGSWSASEVAEWLDEYTEYLPRPATLSRQGFCLRVRGISMMPEFRPNDVIFVEPNVGVWDLKNGDLVVVRENGNQEATFKQLILGDTSEDMYLKPLNPDWHEQKMIPKSEWELVGKVIGKWVRY